MTGEEPQTESARRPILAYVIGAVVVAVSALLLIRYLGSTRSPVAATVPKGVQSEDPQEAARDILSKAREVTACRAALTRVSQYVVQHPDKKPSRPTSAQTDFLKAQLHLDADELTEVASETFTLLDAHYLEYCLLLRDAAQALDVAGANPLDRAAAAFAWVVRQVCLEEQPRGLFSPAFILRRGWGTSQERALVYLALLQQLGLEGCAVVFSDVTRDQPVIWACGILVEDSGRKDIYLFDPRLGLPMPGPAGKGIATLAEVRTRPEVLAQLTVDPKLPYDVTPKKAQQSQLQIGCPLSALAPRMKLLEEVLRSPSLRTSLARDPVAAFERLQQAAGKESRVVFWTEPTRVQRRFLPPEEGGIDRQQLKVLLDFSLAPLHLLPPEIQQLEGVAGNRLKYFFAAPFTNLLLTPRMPRDLLLRGRFNEVSPVLVRMRDEALQSRARYANDPTLRERAREWFQRAQDAYAQLAEAQGAAGRKKDLDVQQQIAAANQKVDELWQEGEKPLAIIVQGAGAEVFGAEVTYLLALCMQEQAERLQARLDRARQAGKGELAEEQRQVQKAWGDALGWWQTYAGEPVKTRVAGAASALVAARRLQARAHAALGQSEEAVKQLEDLSGALSAEEKVARLYQAQQLKKRVP